ncbi:hypothetical protein I302_102923 [Kwoniella bestiolae CBS 10118]|uniref:Uncharacterized protein n=1 Tax=Kwoniella bestiolae CBS 10118 TaxID=1296100 RepID=A0A1B9GGB2_9TREE|nr:hypothetical protein I302_01619 [Kwoniella bestiolae CBS 10118]OCF30100.1 hypothetical protein I302_01619 [Kwoniella bestiolae CBS 10118]
MEQTLDDFVFSDSNAHIGISPDSERDSQTDQPPDAQSHGGFCSFQLDVPHAHPEQIFHENMLAQHSELTSISPTHSTDVSQPDTIFLSPSVTFIPPTTHE